MGTEVEDSDKLHFQSSQDNKSSSRTQNEAVNQVSSSEQVAHQHLMAVGARGAVEPEASTDECRSVNPISTEGADYAHHNNTAPTGFSDLPTALQQPTVITTQGSSSSGQFLENQDIATDKLHCEQSVSKDDGYISNNAITTTKSDLKRAGVPQTENSSLEEGKTKKSKIDKASNSHSEYLLWIKKTRREITETWTKYKQQSTMELRQEIIHLTKRIQQQLDEFSDSSDETIIQEQNSLENEISNIKNELQKEEYLLWIKKTRKEITETWTKYKQQSTMELRQEIIHLTKRIQQQLDEFSDSSDETITQEQNILENEISNIKNELQKEDNNCLDEIAVTLQHADALITSYELDSTVFLNPDLLKLATMLDQAHSKLDDLNRKDLDDQNEIFADKFSNLKDLYVKLVRRLQTLRQLRDHTAQVDTLKFEQDVGLQTEGPPSQDLSTQTETDAWIKTWISQVSQQLNSIETHMISDNQNLLTLLEDLCNLSEVEIESNQRKITDTNLLKSLQILKNNLKEKRSELIYSQQMNYLVDELINENDELNIMKLLHAIPSKGPFTKRLKEALRKIQEKKNNDEFPLSTDLPTASTEITEAAPSDPQDTQHQESSCRRWIYRWARASLPFQAGLLVLLGVLSLAPIWKEEIICSFQNNFRDSIEPMLSWSNGSPPI